MLKYFIVSIQILNTMLQLQDQLDSFSQLTNLQMSQNSNNHNDSSNSTHSSSYFDFSNSTSSHRSSDHTHYSFPSNSSNYSLSSATFDSSNNYQSSASFYNNSNSGNSFLTNSQSISNFSSQSKSGNSFLTSINCSSSMKNSSKAFHKKDNPSIQKSSHSSHQKSIKNHSQLEPNQCTICLGKIKQKCTLNCNHTYCHQCITQWLQTTARCPLCRQRVIFYNYNFDRITVESSDPTYSSVDSDQMSDEDGESQIIMQQGEYHYSPLNCQICLNPLHGHELAICIVCMRGCCHIDCFQTILGHDGGYWICENCHM